ncbi:lactate dehydrogenase [Clostridium thailandense]|uniref:lactate dehydrogenase n=1 Tax=Clostridium thailandense TaxID=2794346 RepID=UPI003989771D
MPKDLLYYKFKNRLLISNRKYDFEEITEEHAKNFTGEIFTLNSINPEKSKRSYYVTSPENLFIDKESLNMLKYTYNNNLNIPNWLLKHIADRNVISINTKYTNWEEAFEDSFQVLSDNKKDLAKWNITVVGLGDVGGTLVTGLRLLGSDCISRINIYDKDEKKAKRWEYECNQILPPEFDANYPNIYFIEEEDLFNCDMFVFCVSVGVPEIGTEASDVRLVQFQGNSKIVRYYAELASKRNFKGIFSVVSDPVDLLCKSAFEGSLDGKTPLLPEKIRGYGLGVMNARACYYAKQREESKHYLKEGRAFGPHGEGLIIADSINNYNEEISDYLTTKTRKANLEVRSIGFKPYIAPALSSGALSIIATIKGNWHYSATFIGGKFMGCRNRLLPKGVELEFYKNMPNKLFNKLLDTYNSVL